MRVPPIGAFGSFGVSKVRKNNAGKQDFIKPIKKDSVSFSSRAQYLKKYVTLPPEIKCMLSAEDAVDMFIYMDGVAAGMNKATTIGEGKITKVYDNPWLKGYDFLVVKGKTEKNNDALVIYAEEVSWERVWQDNNKNKQSIQILKRVA